jgi:hypothetical protein
VAYEFRNNIDFQFGTLTSAVAISDTTLSSAEFTGLATGYSTGNYFPIIMLNPSAKTHEKAWIVGHSSASADVTVVRGRESTSAQAWPSGTQWVSGPTIRDGLMPSTAASPPSDPHVGQRAVYLDTSVVVERTIAQGWMGSVRANAADMGRAIDGTTSHTAGRVPHMKMWTATGTTTAGGFLAVTIPNGGFATRLLSVVVTRYGTSTPVIFTLATTTTITTLQILCTEIGGGPAASTSTTVCILATGY